MSSIVKKSGLAISVLVIAVISVLTFFGKKDPPNIVFIIIDTLRADHTQMGSAGTGETPALQRLFREGSAYFGSSWANAPWTLPSISSMITSKYPTEIGVLKRNSRIDEKFVTLAEILRDNGYATHGVITHIFLKKKYGLGQGFDTYLEKIDSEDNNLLSVTSPVVTAEALKIIDQNEGKPFFMFLHYFDPHYRYIDHEGASEYTGPFLPGEDESRKAQIIKANLFSDDDLNYFRECYRSEIRFTDAHIATVIIALKERGLYDNTVIVIVSDHGEEFGERGSLGHGQSLFNEQTRVPFILKLSRRDRSAAKKIRPLFSNIDISPTILDAAGIEPPASFSGTSIFREEGPETVFMEVNEKKYDTLYHQSAVVHNGWKLIRDFEKKTFGLYRLSGDEPEKVDSYESDKRMFFKLHKILNKYIKMTEKNRHVSGSTKLTEEEQKKLDTLGYISD